MPDLLKHGLALLPLILTTACSFGLLSLLHWLLIGRRPDLGKEQRLPRQLALLVVTLIAILFIVLALPVSHSLRNNILGLLGILLSGLLALGSTTITANFMAGLMLRITRRFRLGDFVRVGEHFGRVAERGLLDTEIQTEHRELISLPNAYLISKPIEVVRASGTLISADMSLGYDVHHHRIEENLLTAAREAGLSEPFMQVIELGDFAVTYRISGLLTEVKSLLTARSNLYKQVLDALHKADIEIVSPTFMNTRALSEKDRQIPRRIRKQKAEPESKIEDIAFDKAEQAESQEMERKRLSEEIQALTEKLAQADTNEKPGLETAITRKREELKTLEEKTSQESSEEQSSN